MATIITEPELTPETLRNARQVIAEIDCHADRPILRQMAERILQKAGEK